MGPSKEELAKYFKNNRKYFDELANHFKKTDPDYYNKSIAPFYSNPFVSAGGAGTRKPVNVLIAAIMFALIMGVVLFFMIYQRGTSVKIYDEDGKSQKDVDKIIDDNDIIYRTDHLRLIDTMEAAKDMANYREGIFFYNIKDYKNAEKYFKEVSDKCPMYPDAELKLKEIKKIKQK